ncbi:streptomycin 6-kinase [Streptomyces sp. KhCrAH-43]|uniref:aminoglycoside phosphotransferase family protein n=1 Tax=unclassified Streptomyces TaxID=2593676 RepID=UPI000365EAE6|nr:aminoglycoside phosphotransferase family protein [Streptomyces sp. KhCrAH-43]MYS33587.1 kinase [Streptomyces sp. SID4920]MYX63820.1 kinase [Streptomyces sp. SID8373]RAJ52828.1 streptomycin 6-kinase [Streptomyces sp. KhCrAH-43]
MIPLPEEFARTTLARERASEEATGWLAGLPNIVEELLDRWESRPDGPPMHGGIGIVFPVRRQGGLPAALKVSFPHPGNRHEPDALATWGGHGAVQLYEQDDEHFAMLLERARPLTLAHVGDEDTVAAIAGQINRRLAVPAPEHLPRLQGQADTWQRQLQEDAAEMPHVLTPYAVAAALATVRELACAQPDTLVHGDLNARNVLAADREPWLAVDPKGWAGDPAFDAGTLLKSRSVVMAEHGALGPAVDRTLNVFTEAAGLDRERTRRWAQLGAVQAALAGRRRGFRRARKGPELNRLLAIVDELAMTLTTPR